MARAERGSVAVEFSFVAVILIAVVLGIVEVGRAMLERGSMSAALERAARETLINAAWTNGDVEDAILEQLGAPDESIYTVDVSSETGGSGGAYRVLAVRRTMALMIPGFGKGVALSVERRVVHL